MNRKLSQKFFIYAHARAHQSISRRLLLSIWAAGLDGRRIGEGTQAEQKKSQVREGEENFVILVYMPRPSLEPPLQPAAAASLIIWQQIETVRP